MHRIHHIKFPKRDDCVDLEKLKDLFVRSSISEHAHQNKKFAALSVRTKGDNEEVVVLDLLMFSYGIPDKVFDVIGLDKIGVEKESMFPYYTVEHAVEVHDQLDALCQLPGFTCDDPPTPLSEVKSRSQVLDWLTFVTDEIHRSAKMTLQEILLLREAAIYRARTMLAAIKEAIPPPRTVSKD